MLNDHYPECHALPAINETFPQFGRSISLLSPLDLSLRASTVIPITPPSTPSPPRKRQRLMSDENYLWRPHVMGTLPLPAATGADTVCAPAGGNYFHSPSYAACDGLQQQQQQHGADEEYKNNLHEIRNNFEEIPTSQVGALKSPPSEESEQGHNNLPIICVDDETIVLTEDEDETTVASSHGCTEDADNEDDEGERDDVEMLSTYARANEMNARNNGASCSSASDVGHMGDDDEDEEEYVDILSNDDDDVNPFGDSSTLRLQRQALEEELEKSGKVLTRNKLVYDNEELHHRAVDGLAKLFERDFHKLQDTSNSTKKTYMDLSACNAMNAESQELPSRCNTPANVTQGARPSTHAKTHKTERKRMKLRKHQLAMDEETISPVSGTIIRKLRDDEELVVRKGDIDPAFNVVEITEEAKAILASIDNKIGAYLCQLCRTLYDDAFMLAQHRCPRIVHIEYKCSECEKVFNCPANLASHRRWHKPKSELLAGGQNKKRLGSEQTANLAHGSHEKASDEGPEGVYPCMQCGKNFRRHAYLKKHQASHEMLESLKSLDIFKHNATMKPNFPQTANQATHLMFPPHSTTASRSPHAPLYNHSGSQPTLKPYAHRVGPFPFPAFDQRRFYTLGGIYLSQQLDRSSAFQYVQANHLRNLTAAAAASNFPPRPLQPPPATLAVK